MKKVKENEKVQEVSNTEALRQVQAEAAKLRRQQRKAKAEKAAAAAQEPIILDLPTTDPNFSEKVTDTLNTYNHVHFATINELGEATLQLRNAHKLFQEAVIVATGSACNLILYTANIGKYTPLTKKIDGEDFENTTTIDLIGRYGVNQLISIVSDYQTAIQRLNNYITQIQYATQKSETTFNALRSLGLLSEAQIESYKHLVVDLKEEFVNRLEMVRTAVMKLPSFAG